MNHDHHSCLNHRVYCYLHCSAVVDLFLLRKESLEDSINSTQASRVLDTLLFDFDKLELVVNTILVPEEIGTSKFKLSQARSLTFIIHVESTLLRNGVTACIVARACFDKATGYAAVAATVHFLHRISNQGLIQYSLTNTKVNPYIEGVLYNL